MSPASSSFAFCLTILDSVHACKAGIPKKIVKAKLEMENKLKLGRGFRPPNTDPKAPQLTERRLHISQQTCRNSIAEASLSVIRAFFLDSLCSLPFRWRLFRSSVHKHSKQCIS